MQQHPGSPCKKGFRYGSVSNETGGEAFLQGL
jgi:hypothetical protein